MAGVVGHKFEIGKHDSGRFGGLTVTTPVRTWCDLAAVVPLPDLVAAGDHILFVGAASEDDLADAVARHQGKRGRTRMIAALELLDGRSESPPESHLRVILIRGGLRGFIANGEIRVPGAKYRGDIVFPRERVVIEYEGDYHREREQWRRDLTRVSRLQAAGWHVMRIGAYDLLDPTDLLSRVRATLELRRHA